MKLTHEDDAKLAILEFDHGKANEIGTEQLEFLASLGTTLTANGTRSMVTFSRRTSSKGTPIFVAGANVTERVGWENERINAHVKWQRSVLAKVRHLPIFHVAVVNGVALGWGTEYLLTCDYRIAVKTAKFGLPETGLGIVPGAGGCTELSSIVGLAQASRLALTGERIDAQEALRIGLVQELVDTVDEGLDRARALAAMVAKKSPTSTAAAKAALLASVGRPYSERADIESSAYQHCLFNGDAAVGRENFSAIRKDEPVAWPEMIAPSFKNEGAEDV